MQPRFVTLRHVTLCYVALRYVATSMGLAENRGWYKALQWTKVLFVKTLKSTELPPSNVNCPLFSKSLLTTGAVNLN